MQITVSSCSHFTCQWREELSNSNSVRQKNAQGWAIASASKTVHLFFLLLFKWSLGQCILSLISSMDTFSIRHYLRTLRKKKYSIAQKRFVRWASKDKKIVRLILSFYVMSRIVSDNLILLQQNFLFLNCFKAVRYFLFYLP